MTTGIVESINKAILPARRLPIIAAHEFLRHLTQKWFSARFEAANKLETSISQSSVVHIRNMDKHVEKSHVFPIRNSVRYQVTNEDLGDGIINVVEWSCTCGMWNTGGFPCVHALSYARFARVGVDHLCHPIYTKKFLQGAYENPIIPVATMDSWGEPTGATRRVVHPMIPTKQAGV